MYDYDDYYEENIYEPSPLDDLMKEYKEKCKTILLSNVQDEIEAIKSRNTSLEKENTELRKNNRDIKSQVSLNEQEMDKIKVFADIFTNIKQHIALGKDRKEKEERIFSFLCDVFEQDYSVKNEYNAPMWIQCLTAFYSHKQLVIEILKLFDYDYTPKDINNFRLPIDWNESELDIFFDTLYNHSCTNGNTYSSNLQWYSGSSLEEVSKQCYRSYSQIPWQFVLRNPLLKQPKYLVRIGKEMITLHYSNANNFNKICEYQKLSDDEIKVIIDNLDYVTWNGKDKDINSFILKNIKLITNNNFLDNVYDYFKDSWSFERNKAILDMPFEYITKWTKIHKNVVSEWLRDNKIEVTKEQRRELMEIILG